MRKYLNNLYRRFLVKPEEMTLLELVRYGNRINKNRYLKADLNFAFEVMFARLFAPHYKTLDLSDTNRFDTVKEDLVSGAFDYLDEFTSHEEWGVNEAYEILRYFDFTYGWHELERDHNIEINGIWDVAIGIMTVFVTDENNGHLDHIVGGILDILKAQQPTAENPQKGENQ